MKSHQPQCLKNCATSTSLGSLKFSVTTVTTVHKAFVSIIEISGEVTFVSTTSVSRLVLPRPRAGFKLKLRVKGRSMVWDNWNRCQGADDSDGCSNVSWWMSHARNCIPSLQRRTPCPCFQLNFTFLIMSRERRATISRFSWHFLSISTSPQRLTHLACYIWITDNTLQHYNFNGWHPNHSEIWMSCKVQFQSHSYGTAAMRHWIPSMCLTHDSNPCHRPYYIFDTYHPVQVELLSCLVNWHGAKMLKPGKIYAKSLLPLWIYAFTDILPFPHKVVIYWICSLTDELVRSYNELEAIENP